jgi:uracil-DNA glycosylase
MKIVLIGEARGETEDQFQHGFCGSSGAELSRMLSESKLAPNIEIQYPSALDLISYWTYLRENHGIAITNVFEEHPPENNLGYFFDSTSRDGFIPALVLPKMPGRYVKPEFRHHITSLFERLSTWNPNICILLGNPACWAVLHQTKISQIRGTIQKSNHLNLKCLPTYHPSYIMRGAWPDRPIVLADLQKAKLESETREIKFLSRKAWFNCTLDEIRAWLDLPAESYAVDIESGYALFSRAEINRMPKKLRYILSSQISMVGFARNPEDAMVIEFMTRDKPNLTYWQDKTDEIAAWKLCQLGLNAPIPKIFQNGMYDINRLLYAGMKTYLPREDTMLQHHAHYPEMKKSLGFMASIYCNESSWKQMYGADQGDSLKRDD